MKKLNLGPNDIRRHLGPMLFVVSFCPVVCLAGVAVPRPVIPTLVGWVLGRLRRPVVVVDHFN